MARRIKLEQIEDTKKNKVWTIDQQGWLYISESNQALSSITRTEYIVNFSEGKYYTHKMIGGIIGKGIGTFKLIAVKSTKNAAIRAAMLNYYKENNL